MKQRIRVVGLVKNSEGVLIFRRNPGRTEAPAIWELPTGKIKFGEQPEEAMARSLTEYTGLITDEVKLKDVVTFMAPEGSSQLSNLYIVYELSVKETVKPTPHDRYTAYKYVRDLTNSNIHLSETSRVVLEIENGKASDGEPKLPVRASANGAMVNVDGASRGNPGPSGIGYCIHDENGKKIEQGGEFIGFATSRLAEYMAMRRGIERAIELGYKSVRFVSDSLMVVNQLNGVFQIKNQDILPIYREIRGKLGSFDAVTFVHVPREQNTCADKEANLAIDRLVKKKK